MLRDDIKPLIPDIVSRKLTNRAVAAMLGASEFTICRILKQMKVVREPVLKEDPEPKRKLLEARNTFRATISKTLSIKEAAIKAGCSTRTIYRWKKK